MTSTSNPPAARLGTVDYDGRRFRPVDAEHGTFSLGVYHQQGDLVWADFSSATVRIGRLVGSCRSDGVIDAAYCFVTADGETIAGVCVSTPTMLGDGRVRLAEHWRRMDGSSGVSEIEEIEEIVRIEEIEEIEEIAE
jgi:hypothetical protein